MGRSGFWRSFPVEVEDGKVIFLDLVASRKNVIGPKGGDVKELYRRCVECGRLCNPFEFLIRHVHVEATGVSYLEGIETGPDAGKCYRHFPEPSPIPYYQMKRLALKIRKLRDASGNLIGFWSLPTKGRTKWRKVAQHKAGIRMVKFYKGPKKGQCKHMYLQPRVDRGHDRDGNPYRPSRSRDNEDSLENFLDELLG